MIIEALAAYGLFRWFTHRCEPVSHTPEDPLVYYLEAGKCIAKLFYADGPKRIRVWSVESPIECFVTTTNGLKEFRADGTINKIGKYKVRDNGQFTAITLPKHSKKLWLVFVNWKENGARTAQIWHEISEAPEPTETKPKKQITKSSSQDKNNEPHVGPEESNRLLPGNPEQDPARPEASVEHHGN